MEFSEKGDEILQCVDVRLLVFPYSFSTKKRKVQDTEDEVK